MNKTLYVFLLRGGISYSLDEDLISRIEQMYNDSAFDHNQELRGIIPGIDSSGNMNFDRIQVPVSATESSLGITCVDSDYFNQVLKEY